MLRISGNNGSVDQGKQNLAQIGLGGWFVRGWFLGIVGCCLALQGCNDPGDVTSEMGGGAHADKLSTAGEMSAMVGVFESRRAEIESTKAVVEDSGYSFFKVTVEAPSEVSADASRRRGELQMRLAEEMLVVLASHAEAICESAGLSSNPGSMQIKFADSTLSTHRDDKSETRFYAVPTAELNDSMMLNCLPASSGTL